MIRRAVLMLALLASAPSLRAAPPATPPAASATPPAKPIPQAKPTPKPTPKPVVKPVLEGTVRGPSGKPAEGALVLARSLDVSSGEVTRTARTDAAGRFRLELKDSGLVAVRVEASGLAARTLEKVDPKATLAVQLDRGDAITGIVQDETGRPVSKAVVEASSDHTFTRPPWEEDDGLLQAVTDPKGHFRLDAVAPGMYTVTARGRGLGSVSQANVVAGARLKLLLRAGSVIAGVVTDVEGRPVGRAFVRAEMEGRAWKASRVERSDQQGRFELLGLEAGSYTLTARHPNYAAAVAMGVRVEKDGATETTLALTPGTTVVGRLVGPEERPATGRVFMQELGGTKLPSALSDLFRTDADAGGSFRLEHAPPGSWVLAVVAPGFAGQRVEAEVSSKDVVLDLGDIRLDPGLTIRGRVHSTNEVPVGNVRIQAFASDPLRSGGRAEARSDSDGAFTLAGLRPSLYRLLLSAHGFASLRKELTAPMEGVDLEMAAGGSVTGMVVDEAGRPVTAYHIAINNTREGEDSSQGEESVGSADGRFALDGLQEGTYVLQATAPDRAPGLVAEVKVVSGRTTDVGAIRLKTGGIVRGIVTDSTGSAVSTASVRVGGPGMDAFEWGTNPSATTDAGGAFEVRGVSAGAQSVVADHPSYAPGETQVDVDPAKAPVEVRITLTHGGRIEGSARKRDGAPIAGAPVHTYATGRRDYGLESPETLTRADGAFALENLPPGPSLLTLMMPSGNGRAVSSLTKQVEVRDGETLTVELVARETLVTGRVTRAQTPLGGMALRLLGRGGVSVSSGGPGVAAPVTGPQRRQAVTAEDGTFEMIVDEPGRYRAQVQSSDGRMRFPMRDIEIPDAETFVLDLAFAGSSISGQVVDKETGAPLPRASVRASPRDSDHGWSNARTSDDGRFELEVEPGPYDVSARAEGYGSGQAQVQVDSSGAPDLRLELARGMAITGRLLDSVGRPVSGLQIAATLEDNSQTEYGTSLPDGSFRIDGLVSSGRWNLAAGTRLAGYGLRIGVPSGEKDVTLSLRRGGVVRLLVLKDGAPLAGAWASVARINGAAVSVPDYETEAVSSPSGQTELGSPPGMVEIEVSNGTLEGTVRVSVPDGGSTSAEVKLTQGPKKK